VAHLDSKPAHVLYYHNNPGQQWSDRVGPPYLHALDAKRITSGQAAGLCLALLSCCPAVHVLYGTLPNSVFACIRLLIDVLPAVASLQ
jgi:hypothetical protein